jgi:hypothetical protein
MTIMRTLTLAAVGALIPASALAQAATRRVYVDATAASGGAVMDLSRDDFEVTEHGGAREVISAELGQRPQRIVLVVDSTDAIRQPLGVVRKALTAFLEVVNPQLEMMLVSVAGTPQVRVRPTLDRQQLVKSADNIFGTSGSNVMHRVIDDVFHRFADTTDQRPIFVVVTCEGFESTQNINLQEIAHVVGHFAARGGTLHAVRLNVPTGEQSYRSGNLTDLPVSLMIGRGTGGAYTSISPVGLLEVLQRLAGIINVAYASTLNYRIEFADQPAKGQKPVAPQVRVSRQGVELKAVSFP